MSVKHDRILPDLLCGMVLKSVRWSFGRRGGEPMELDITLVNSLIAEAKSGSQAARSRLITESLPLLEGWSRGHSKTLHRLRLSCRDLTQVVVLIVEKHFTMFQGDTAASWFAWLKQIHFRMVQSVVNDVRNAQTYSINDTSVVEANQSTVFVSQHSTPGSLAALKEQSDKVKKVIGQIEPQLQDALSKWMDGVTLEDHATQLNLKVHQIRYLRFKALQEFNRLWINHRVTG